MLAEGGTVRGEEIAGIYQLEPVVLDEKFVFCAFPLDERPRHQSPAQPLRYLIETRACFCFRLNLFENKPQTNAVSCQQRRREQC